MPCHGLYAVFFMVCPANAVPRSQWAMGRNRRNAIKFARRVGGMVCRMNLPDKSSRVWDAPTFRALSDVIADFTPAAKETR